MSQRGRESFKEENKGVRLTDIAKKSWKMNSEIRTRMSLASLVRGASVDGRVRLGWDETQAGGKAIEYKEGSTINFVERPRKDKENLNCF